MWLVVRDRVEVFSDAFYVSFVFELGERVAALALPARHSGGQHFEVTVGHSDSELTFVAAQ
jgi:hypothetical protein